MVFPLLMSDLSLLDIEGRFECQVLNVQLSMLCIVLEPFQTPVFVGDFGFRKIELDLCFTTKSFPA